jgi:hypothetical protein
MRNAIDPAARRGQLLRDVMEFFEKVIAIATKLRRNQRVSRVAEIFDSLTTI